jgi:hypothetical protein
MSESTGPVGGWDDGADQEPDYLKKAKANADRSQTASATAFALIDIAESLRRLVLSQESR